MTSPKRPVPDPHVMSVPRSQQIDHDIPRPIPPRPSEQEAVVIVNHSPGALLRAPRARHSWPRSMSPLRRALQMTAAAIVACGGVFLVFTTTASASTVNGVATIADGTTDLTLPSGGSTALFTVNLPAGAACDGDSATGGYLVDSYLVPEGASVASQTFVGGGPSTGEYGLVDQSGTYYGGANTAITTGQIVSIPSDLQWAPLVTSDHLLSTLLNSGTTGVWEAGIACANSSGAVVDNWNTQVTFTASSSDPNGFTWSAVPGVPSTSGTTTTTTPAGGTTTTTTAGGTTSTTTPGGTTPTTAGGITSTTTGGTITSTGAGATTTTTAGTTSTTDPSPVNAASGSAGSSGTTGSSGSTGSGASGGVLAFTGLPASVAKILGMGLLVVGIGLMLLAGKGDRNGVGALRTLRRRVG
jgi:hypothetical protein